MLCVFRLLFLVPRLKLLPSLPHCLHTPLLSHSPTHKPQQTLTLSWNLVLQDIVFVLPYGSLFFSEGGTFQRNNTFWLSSLRLTSSQRRYVIFPRKYSSFTKTLIGSYLWERQDCRILFFFINAFLSVLFVHSGVWFQASNGLHKNATFALMPVNTHTQTYKHVYAKMQLY